jgi:hypothetical protein
LTPIFEDYEKQRVIAFDAHAKDKDEDGNPVLKPGSKHHREFMVEIEKILDQEETIEIPEIPLTKFIEAYGKWPPVSWYGDLSFMWPESDCEIKDNFKPTWDED